MVICECRFSDCRAHRGKYACPVIATLVVKRLRGDFAGTLRMFCDACAVDATTGNDALEFAIVKGE